jgi:murein DD-endopeptidase MepM/ murein hydrolase activator NlpD
MVGAGCERTDESAAASPDEYVIRATMPGDSVATVVESVTRVPAPTQDATPAQPDASTSETDARLFATPEELAQLSAGLVVPVQGVMRSELRDSYDEARGARVHEALDIIVARGTPVLSAADGRVLKLFNSVPGGLMVYAADPSERFILLYGHLDAFAPGLTDGMPLQRGQVIGYVGTTGNAPAGTPHLHFGIMRGNPSVSWWEGMPVNPYPLFVAPPPAR